MKRVVSVVVGLAAALSGMVALSPTASAYGGYDATATNVSYTSDSCFTSHIVISGFDTSDEAPSHEIEVTKPDGAYEDSDIAYGSYTETLSTLLCNGIDVTGRYSVRVDGVEVTSFRVTRPVFANRVVYPGTRSAQVRGRMTLDGRPLANRTVGVEFLQYGTWSRVATRRTNYNGSAAVACSVRGRTCGGLYRFNYNDVAISRAFHLPRRR